MLKVGMCCRRRAPPTPCFTVVQFRWRRVVLRKIFGRSWHYIGEYLKAVKAKAALSR